MPSRRAINQLRVWTTGATRGRTRNDRHVKSRIVACPECGAAIGEFCITKAGTKAGVAHTSRRRLALRSGG